MKLVYKDDWEEAQRRTEAWWKGEIIDRVPIKITAPKKETERYIRPRFLPHYDKNYEKNEIPEITVNNLENYFTDPKQVIPRLEREIKDTYWAGEAFPVMFPVSIGMVAILANYLGCPIKFMDTRTTWSTPIINNWNNRPKFCFNPENKWWQKTKILLHEAAARAPGHYFVGIPELDGPSEILSCLRGNANLAIDTIEHPEEIKQAVKEINYAWLRYWEASLGLIHQYIGGYIFWMAIWSESPATELECDFSCLISSNTFNDLFLPFIEQQIEWIPRTIYHLDGPCALQHLDSLLSLSHLTGIQWIPGAGSPPMSEWIPLLKKIQGAGKLLYITCEKGEVRRLLKELNPEGLLLETTCSSIKEADELINNVKKWM